MVGASRWKGSAARFVRRDAIALDHWAKDLGEDDVLARWYNHAGQVAEFKAAISC